VAEGDLADAQHLYEDSLKKFQQIGDPWGAAGVLRDLGDLASRNSDHSRAASLYQEALGIFHKLGYRRGMAIVLEHLAVCATFDARPDVALKLAGAAAVIREDLGISTTPAEHEEVDRTIQMACEKLPKLEQSKAWEEGRTMTAGELLELVQGRRESRPVEKADTTSG